MDTKKASKAASLIVSILVLLIHVSDCSSVGAYKGCGLPCRLLYPLHHANLLHATLNAWCLLSVIFIYEIPLFRLILAYIAAVCVPSFCLSDIPTVGLSCIVFVLFGSISFEVKRKAYYQLWMLAYLVAGFFLPNTNALVHLYCYLAGVAVALVNKPIKIG